MFLYGINFSVMVMGKNRQSFPGYFFGCAFQPIPRGWSCFGFFLFDTSLLPPVFHGGEWKTVDDDEAVYFILPSARSLFNVWKRHVDALCRGGLSVPWLSRLASVSSVALLGAKFRCAGIGGFVPVPKSALCDLSLQFHSVSSLRDLRIPYVN